MVKIEADNIHVKRSGKLPLIKPYFEQAKLKPLVIRYSGLDLPLFSLVREFIIDNSNPNMFFVDIEDYTNDPNRNQLGEKLRLRLKSVKNSVMRTEVVWLKSRPVLYVADWKIRLPISLKPRPVLRISVLQSKYDDN